MKCYLEFYDSKNCLYFGLDLHLDHNHKSLDLEVLDCGQQKCLYIVQVMWFI